MGGMLLNTHLIIARRFGIGHLIYWFVGAMMNLALGIRNLILELAEARTDPRYCTQ